MIKKLIATFILIAGTALGFPYAFLTNSQPTVPSQDWKDFTWVVNNATDYMLSNRLASTQYSNVIFRMATPDGRIWTTIYSGDYSSNLYRAILAASNMPPPNTYYAEYLAGWLSGTNYTPTRVLMRGKVTTQWSVWNFTNSVAYTNSVNVITQIDPLSESDPRSIHTNHAIVGGYWDATNSTLVITGALAAPETDPVYLSQTGRYYSASNPSNYIPSNTVSDMIADVAGGLGTIKSVIATSNGLATVETVGGTSTVTVTAGGILAVGNSNYYSLADGRAVSNLAVSLVGPLANVSGRVATVEGRTNDWNAAYAWGNHAGLYVSTTGGIFSAMASDGGVADAWAWTFGGSNGPNVSQAAQIQIGAENDAMYKGGEIWMNAGSWGGISGSWVRLQIDANNALPRISTYGRIDGDGGGITNVNADLLDGQEGAYYLNGTNLLAASVGSNKVDAATDTAYRGALDCSTLSGTNFTITGSTIAYEATATSAYAIAVSPSAQRFTYSLRVINTQSVAYAAGVALQGAWVQTGTNILVLVPFTGTTWHVYGRGL